MSLKRFVVQLLKKTYDGLVYCSSVVGKKKFRKSQVAYLLSFPNNNFGLIEQLAETFSLTVFFTNNCAEEAQALKQQGIKCINLDRPLSLFFFAVPKIAGCKVIVCDNYFALLGSLALKTTTHTIQIWHANGAIKKFGWEDQQTALRSRQDQKRFQKVYNSFDSVVVGSERMAAVFKASYHLADQRIVRSGLPRTDSFFNQKQREFEAVQFTERFPEATGKRVILYAPTYREHEPLQPLDAEALMANLDEDSFLLYKFHPHTTGISYPQTETISDLRGLDLADILSSVDCLITDYSSIPFEYSLVKPTGKMLFYCYDLDSYKNSVGLQDNFEEWAKKGLVFEEEVLIEKLNQKQGLTSSTLNSQWNTYNDGHATERLLKQIRELVNNEE